jgi:hypothetical protein
MVSAVFRAVVTDLTGTTTTNPPLVASGVAAAPGISLN